MRIAITAQHHREVGGLEIYLKRLFQGFLRAGHEVAFLHELDEPSSRLPITGGGMPHWCVEELGPERALEELRAWQPELILGYGLHDPELEARTLDLAPGIFFGGHGYHGICISGSKTFQAPDVRPCGKQFGWQCLLHYLPRRCGGLSPVTMVKEYGRQRAHHELLARYRFIVTNGEQLAADFARHGFRTRVASYGQRPPGPDGKMSSALVPITPAAPAELTATAAPGSSPWRLLFLGRMQSVKGGHMLLRALPQVASELGRPLTVTFVGDGPDRDGWESLAGSIQARHPGVRIEFRNWIASDELGTVWRSTHLLVVPSLWAEPFATVGQEARGNGIPVVAFAVGGNVDWLLEGVNGHLAPGDPPSAEGLAAAIVNCLRDPEHYQALRNGAAEMDQWFGFGNHVTALLNMCEEVILGGAGPGRSEGTGRSNSWSPSPRSYSTVTNT